MLIKKGKNWSNILNLILTGLEPNWVKPEGILCWLVVYKSICVNVRAGACVCMWEANTRSHIIHHVCHFWGQSTYWHFNWPEKVIRKERHVFLLIITWDKQVCRHSISWPWHVIIAYQVDTDRGTRRYIGEIILIMMMIIKKL